MVQNFGTISPEEAFGCLKEQVEPLLQDHGQTSTD